MKEMEVTIENKKYEVEECKYFSKARGLMFSKKRNLIFELKEDEIVHSLFVSFPIKLYFLDEKFRLLEKKKLRPFWGYVPKFKAKYLVEISL